MSLSQCNGRAGARKNKNNQWRRFTWSQRNNRLWKTNIRQLSCLKQKKNKNMIVKNIYLRTGQYFKMVTCIATVCAAIEKDTIKDFIIFNNSWDPISSGS